MLTTVGLVGPAAGEELIHPLQKKINESKAKAVSYLLGLQQDKMVIYSGPKKTSEEIDAEFKDVVIVPDSVTGRPTTTVRIKGREIKDVSAILPPGWFRGDPIKNDGHPLSGVGGASALATLALLAAGVDPMNEPKLLKAIESVLNMHGVHKLPEKLRGRLNTITMPPPPAKKGTNHPELHRGSSMVYALGIQCSAVEYAIRALNGRRSDIFNTAQKWLNFAGLLLENGYGSAGGYNYYLFDGAYDMSCTQYGLLGLWACARANVEISDRTWEHFNKWLLDKQQQDGGWSYRDNENPKSTMTEAGIASLYLCMDYLHTRRRGTTGPDIRPFSNDPLLTRTVTALNRGFDNFGRIYSPNANNAYYMYGAERIGVASGLKYFGDKDWYRMGADALVKAQKPDGSWMSQYGILCGTSWNLMFLAFGGAPVLVNKIIHGPREDMQFWNNYPRDAANLAGWYTKFSETNTNYQVLDIATAKVEDDLMDAPLAYISGYKALELTDQEVDKLRLYIERGGTLLFVAAGTDKNYTRSVLALGERLYSPERFPDYQFTAMPETHPIYTLGYTGKKSLLTRVPIWHMNNGHRSFALLIPNDIAFAWHSNRHVASGTKEYFELVANIRSYGLDKSLLPDKIRPAITQGETKSASLKGGGPIKVAVVKYASKGRVPMQKTPGVGKPEFVEVLNDWAGSPQTWPEFNRWFSYVYGREVQDFRGIALTDPELQTYSLLHLTGHHAFELTIEEIEALQSYLKGGGTLLVEPTGGIGSDFYQSAIENLRKVFPDGQLQNISLNHPIISGQGTAGRDMTRGDFSRHVKLTMPNLTSPAERLRVITVNGRVAVVLSSLDWSLALAGQPCWERLGLSSATARGLTANLVAYASGGAITTPPDAAKPATPTKPAPKPAAKPAPAPKPSATPTENSNPSNSG